MRNVKAVSTLIMVILMLVSAFIGGILSYMFTIPQFIAMPTTTNVAVTGIFFDKDDAHSFKVSILNPSYSPTNVTINRIAVSISGADQLYDIVETTPPLQAGIEIQVGETINVTCTKVFKDGFSIGWGDFVPQFPGQTIIVHVFASGYPAANAQSVLPFVRLNMTDIAFDPDTSFGKFTMTVSNAPLSATDLTIFEILVPSLQITEISPALPLTVPHGQSVFFTCVGNWSDLAKSKTIVTISAFTEQGYSFSATATLPIVNVAIQNATFNENDTDHFNVTVSNTAMQSSYVNVTKISATLDNGTAIDFPFPSLGVETNATRLFTVDWSWKYYRGRSVGLTAFLLQEAQTDMFNVMTPQPIILESLNQDEAFNLQDRTHFSITLQSHLSNVDSVNVTRMKVVETGETIDGPAANPQLPYGPMSPGQSQAFYCSMTDWTNLAGGNLTITVYVVTNQTSQQFTFNFTFTLPKAVLNITTINVMIGGKNLNVTVQNLGYSVWNLTVSEVIIQLGTPTETFTQTFPANQILLHPGETISLICTFNWINYLETTITVTVGTQEGVQATQTFQIP